MSSSFDKNFSSGSVIKSAHVQQLFGPIEDIESGTAWYREDEGVIDAFKVDFSAGNQVAAYAPGLLIFFKAMSSNTGACTLTIKGPSGDLAPIPLRKQQSEELAAGDVAVGQVVCAVYAEEPGSPDPVNKRFEVIGSLSGSGSSGGSTSSPEWASISVLSSDLTLANLADQDLGLATRLSGTQIDVSQNNRIELDEGLYLLEFSVVSEINSGAALEVGLFEYGGPSPVEVVGSRRMIAGHETKQHASSGYAFLDVASGQTKDIGLRTVSGVVDGTIFAGEGRLNVLKISAIGGTSAGSHTHEISEVNGLSAALGAKQAQDSALDDISGLALAKGDILVHDGTNVSKLASPGAANDGHLLSANSTATEGVEWAAPPAPGAGSLDQLSDVAITGSPASDEFLKHDGSNFTNVAPSAVRTALDVPANSDLTSGLAAKADTSHSHDAADINSGTIPIARGGTGASTAGAARTALDVPSNADLTSGLAGKANISHTHDAADIASGTLPLGRGGTGSTTAGAARTALDVPSNADLTTGLAGKQATSEKGQANGYAELDSTGKVPASQLPSGAGSALNDLSDVTLTSPTSGDIIQHNGTVFANQPVSGLGLVSNSRQVLTSAPLSGGGALTADLTLSLPQANGSQDGYLSATDHANFSSKQNQSALLDDVASLAVAPGDIMYVDSNSEIKRLPKGTNGQFLSLVSDVPAWTDAPSGGSGGGSSGQTMELVYANTVAQSATDTADITDSFTADGTSTYLFVATVGSTATSINASIYGELKIKIGGTDFLSKGSSVTTLPRGSTYGTASVGVDAMDRVFKKTMSGLSGSVTITFEKGGAYYNLVQLEIYKL